MHKRSAGVALLTLALLLGACAGTDERSGASGDGASAATKTYKGNGVTFEYPDDWDELPAKLGTATGSNELWSTTVGVDRTNLVIITAYGLNIEVTEENLESIESELDGVIKDVVDKAGGEITTGPTAGEVAGFPAYTYTWEGVEVSGEPKDSSAYFLFDGDVEYFFNCQYSDEAAEEVQAGCDQILESFAVTRAA